jgi:DNA modification methylase
MEYKREFNNKWSFRDSNTKDYTHCYHSYPAMMIPLVARNLIHEFKPSGEFNLLFDPYMGSGTSLVESSLIGVNSIGTDLNPLARLMAKVKTTHYDTLEVKNAFSDIQFELGFYSPDLVENKNFERISNYTFWYTEDSLLRLSFLNQVIDKFPSCKDFFRLILSEVVREVSFTRNGEFKRFRMKEERLKSFKPDVFKTFQLKGIRNIHGLEQFNSIKSNDAKSIICDFNSSINIPSEIVQPNSVDMIVTSPPYGDSHTTVAYGQFSRWANEWFDFKNAKNLDSILMGGKKNSVEMFQTESIREVIDEIRLLDEKRYKEVVSFLDDYWASIQNVSKTVRNGGVICYVVGNRTVKGIQIPLDYFTIEMFEKCGFNHEITIVREIPNKRMPSKTSPTNIPGEKVETMGNEYIVIMKKEME